MTFPLRSRMLTQLVMRGSIPVAAIGSRGNSNRRFCSVPGGYCEYAPRGCSRAFSGISPRDRMITRSGDSANTPDCDPQVSPAWPREPGQLGTTSYGPVTLSPPLSWLVCRKAGTADIRHSVTPTINHLPIELHMVIVLEKILKRG